MARSNLLSLKSILSIHQTLRMILTTFSAHTLWAFFCQYEESRFVLSIWIRHLPMPSTTGSAGTIALNAWQQMSHGDTKLPKASLWAVVTLKSDTSQPEPSQLVTWASNRLASPWPFMCLVSPPTLGHTHQNAFHLKIPWPIMQLSRYWKEEPTPCCFHCPWLTQAWGEAQRHSCPTLASGCREKCVRSWAWLRTIAAACRFLLWAFAFSQQGTAAEVGKEQGLEEENCMPLLLPLAKPSSLLSHSLYSRHDSWPSPGLGSSEDSNGGGGQVQPPFMCLLHS